MADWTNYRQGLKTALRYNDPPLGGMLVALPLYLMGCSIGATAEAGLAGLRTLHKAPVLWGQAWDVDTLRYAIAVWKSALMLPGLGAAFPVGVAAVRAGGGVADFGGAGLRADGGGVCADRVAGHARAEPDPVVGVHDVAVHDGPDAAPAGLGVFRAGGGAADQAHGDHVAGLRRGVDADRLAADGGAAEAGAGPACTPCG